MEKVIAVDQQAFIMLIDYSKVFDSVCHSQLIEIFLETDSPKHLAALIHLYTLINVQPSGGRANTHLNLRLEKETDGRQGCLMSPHLFVTYTEKGTRDAEASSFGTSVAGRRISNLRYADDTTLIEGSKEAIEQLTTNVIEAGKELNLKLNVKKTKLLVAGRAEEEHYITIDGESVKQVESFKYLGSTKTATANCSGDIKTRIAIAKRRIIELQDLCNDKNLTKLVKALIWIALTYGAEAWTLFEI